MQFENLYGVKIDWEKPVITLDVNQIALKPPACWPAGLPQLEYNYFKTEQLELCVTPTTSGELTCWKDINDVDIGSRTFDRFTKSQLFKSRPEHVRANFNALEADSVWNQLRKTLWPTDKTLIPNQFHDVSQLYFHTIVSGSLSNSAFVTEDNNFLNKREAIQREVGVSVMTPKEAWAYYQPKFNLYEPSLQECHSLWSDQAGYLSKLKEESLNH